MFEPVVQNPQQTFTNVANLTPPGFGQSFLNGLVSSYITPNAAIEDIGHAISKTPGEGWAQSALDYYGAQQNIGGSSTAGNIVGSTLGFFLNPEIGGVVQAGLKGAAKAFAAGELPRLGSAATTALGSGAAFSGSMAPYVIPDNYNPQNGNIDWGGVGKSLGIYAGIGMALPVLPYTAGIVAGKVRDWRAANPVLSESENAATASAAGVPPSDLDAARDAGAITPDEHAFMSAINNKQPIDSGLVKNVADHNAVQYSPSGHVDVPLATGDDLQNIQKTVPDELASVSSDTPPEQVSPMSNHILNSRLDGIAQSPQMIDGIQGFADHVDSLMENKDAYLDAVDNQLDTSAGIDSTHPLSQERLFNAAKDEPINRANLPNEVQNALAHEDKIDQARGVAARRAEQLQRENLSEADIATRQSRLDDANTNLSNLEADRPQLLSPDEELSSIRKRLLDGSDLNSMEKIADKQRLDDLARVSQGARNLRDRIDLEEQYQRQAAFSTVAKAVVQKVQSGVDMDASNKNVMDYLHNRVQEKIKSFSEAKKVSTPTANDFESLEKEAATSDLKKSVQQAKAKVDEFEEKQNVLQNALNCILGK